MTCRAALALIEQASDAALAPRDRAGLDTHLAVCAACRRASEAHRRLSQAARRWAAPSPADDPGAAFNARVLAQVSVRPAPRLSAWLPLAATVAVLVVLAMLPDPLRPSPGWPETGWLVASARLLPGWLAANLSALPAAGTGLGDALLSSGSQNILQARAGWVWGVLAAAALLNAACAHAARSRARRSLP